MGGLKYLIFVLPCLLHILHVVSSEENNKDHDDKQEINMVQLKSENENITPVAAFLFYNWWKSIPLDFMKPHSKYEKPEDHDEIDKMLKENITPAGFEKLQEWWLKCPTFNMLNSTLFSKDENHKMTKDDIHDYLTNSGFKKITGEEVDKLVNDPVMNPDPVEHSSNSYYDPLPNPFYPPVPSFPDFGANSYSDYWKPKRMRPIRMSREYSYNYGY